MEITKEYIFKCFRNELSDDEKAALDAWIGESEANARIYREALVEFEYMVVNGDIGVIRDRRPDMAAKRPAVIRKAVKIAGGVAAAAAIFLCAILWSDFRTRREMSRNLLSATARPGQIMTMTLGDGTSVHLNSGSTIYYPALFKGRERVVEVEGEAFFEVKHDSSRPFIVRTFASDIEVLGTKFNVDADRENGRFSVTLAEGSVKVTAHSDPGTSVILKPDEKACLDGGRLTLAGTRAKDEIRWKDGIIDIGGMSFGELMDKLEMSFGVDIVMTSDTMPELRFTDGRLRISDGIDYALSVIQKGADFTWTKDFRTGTIYIR